MKAETWEKLWQGMETQLRWSKPDNGIIRLIPKLKKENIHRVLDLGCGIGRHVIFMAKSGFETYGLDSSEHGISHCQKWLTLEGLKAVLTVKDMQDLPYKTAFFDFVISWNVIYHTTRSSMETILSELSRVICRNGLLLHFYCLNFIINIGLLPTLISFAGTLTILFTLPVFTYTLLGIDFTLSIKRLFFANGIVYFTSLWFIVKTTPEELVGPFSADVPEISNLIVYIIYGLSFFGTLSHCFILGFIKGKAVGDKQLQKIRMTTFGVSLFFLIPLIVLTAAGKTRAAVVCLSIMFLSISIINLYFSIFFANKPCYFNNSSLTAYFVSHFKISDREKEVIALLLEGMANKEIAEVIFISPRTVENHLSSVYQKTEVNSRIQLINLIRANASS